MLNRATALRMVFVMDAVTPARRDVGREPVSRRRDSFDSKSDETASFAEPRARTAATYADDCVRRTA
jgi:hypothetical protein